jgi:von Willebrand factor type A domain
LNLMTRATITSLVVAALGLVGCGSKHSVNSLCDSPTPPPECSMTCSPTGPNTCPAGFHCSVGGTCDAECTPGGDECGPGMMCTDNGACVSTGGVDGPHNTAPDAECPAIHFTATPTIPSVEVLIDGSGSMTTSFGNTDRYTAVRDGLVGASGVITALQASVYFGAAVFTSDTPCPTLAKVARAMNDATAIQTLINSVSPGGTTPTAKSIDAVVADFATNPPPTGSPPIIVLATDGEPNSCTDSTTNPGPSITAAQNAYNAGIRLYILGLAGLNTTFLQDMANAGVGVQNGQPDAPYYTADSPQALQDAFNSIIGGVLSCDLTITGGQIDTSQASSGSVVLNGVTLVYGTDWILVNGTTIELTGQACDDLKSSSNPMVDATFPCGAVIIVP